MISLKDLPDWATGPMIGVTAWFAVSYGLAPRAMTEEVNETIVPSCVDQLSLEQDKAIAEATKRVEEDRAYEIDKIQRAIRNKESTLRQYQGVMSQYNSLKGMFDESGLGALVPMPKPTIASQAEIDALRADIKMAKAKLSNLSPITLPRIDAAGLAETCSCAAMETIAGKRTEYAISLASFRLISPKEIASVKSDVAHTLRWNNACGGKPWKEL